MIGSKKRILVVDDDEGVLKTLSEYLSLKGYEVDVARQGREAIEKTANHFFNLAVLDIKLPDIEGTELLSKMHDTQPRMVKIMLTGYPDLDNSIKSLNGGADAYLVKPVQPKELLTVIERKLKNQNQELKMDQDKLIEYMESREKELEEKERKTH
jgi:DNA-binding NtrC family response regulator